MREPASAPLRLTVLGSSKSIPRPRRACSSYLVEAAGAAVVADLGSGALANLLAVRPADSVDAVVISHMHADHFLDLVPLRYALTYGPRANDRRVPVYLPAGGRDVLVRLVAAFDREGHRDFLAAFEIREYDAASVLRVGALHVRFAAATHYIRTCAMRFEAHGGSLAYSADTAPSGEVAALAAGADAFVCEASLGLEPEPEPSGGHLSPRDAGALAARANVGRLLLSHYGAEAQPQAMIASARAAGFAGAIDVVDDLDRFAIGTPADAATRR